MGGNSTPRVSIGMPVYNGEDFLEEALEAILAQTFDDFEFIVSDNASTDRTEAICRAYADRDARIRYFRNAKNLGASDNFNRVFTLSSGDYFKWVAHDDLHQPDFLSKCIQILDRDPTVVLAYTRAVTIDWKRQPIRREWGAGPELGSVRPHERFRESLAPPNDPIPLPIFGVIRANILRKTRLVASYPDCDRALLAELSLYGRFYEVPEALFLQREHQHRAGPHLSRDPYWAVTFWDPKTTGKIVFPHWWLFAGHLSAITRAPLSWRERVHCYIILAGWLKRHRQKLLHDLAVNAERLPSIGPVIGRAYKRYLQTSWVKHLHQAVQDIDSLIPIEATVILVDDASFGAEAFAGRRTRPFLEREGQYWGPPPDDETAIRELERMRRSGASFMVFGWPAFWWLDYYSGLHDYLNSKFRCILQNSRLIVFDLQL